MKAVLQYRASPEFCDQLHRTTPDWLDIDVIDEADLDRFRLAIADAQVLLHVLEPVTAEVFSAAPQLKLVQKIGVGVNTIDLDSARSHGVAVANMPGTNSRAVAEMTLMLMLAALRQISLVDPLTRRGEGWTLEPAALDEMGEIAGRTVGFVGYGAVPRLLAPIVHAMGAEVVYTARAPKEDAIGEWRTLDDLVAEADIVSLHVPLTTETRHLIDADRLATMRPGAILVNTARGDLIDEAALVEALGSGRLRAAGLDVFVEEPVAVDNPLLSLPNVVVTPHLAWLTPETLDRSITVAIENCRRLRDGESLLHQVA